MVRYRCLTKYFGLLLRYICGQQCWISGFGGSIINRPPGSGQGFSSGSLQILAKKSKILLYFMTYQLFDSKFFSWPQKGPCRIRDLARSVINRPSKSGSIIQYYGFGDPDPEAIFMDPQHRWIGVELSKNPCYSQCCGSEIFYPGSRILIFIHPGSRISDAGSRILNPVSWIPNPGSKNRNKKGGDNNCSLNFFCHNKYHKM